MDIWANLLNDATFLKEIETNGFSKERGFVDYLKKEKLFDKIDKSGAITASSLSIDFFSKQSNELRDRGYYVIRTGRGKFVIFRESEFPRPYLDLDFKLTEKISSETPKRFENLATSFKENLIENASIEQLHFNGAFSKIISQISGEAPYYIGPRGNRTSKFDVYFRRNSGETEKIFSYNGQEELDYSIFTENHIFVIEAKNLPSGGNDVGWHKLAYPANRFKKFSSAQIHPCYLLKHERKVFFSVFPEFEFFNAGIVLNERKFFTPLKTFEIDI